MAVSLNENKDDPISSVFKSSLKDLDELQKFADSQGKIEQVLDLLGKNGWTLKKVE